MFIVFLLFVVLINWEQLRIRHRTSGQILRSSHFKYSPYASDVLHGDGVCVHHGVCVACVRDPCRDLCATCGHHLHDLSYGGHAFYANDAIRI